MKHLFAAALCAFCALPAHAGLLDWLTGKSAQIACAPTDRRCLWQAGVDTALANRAARACKPNAAPYARQLVQLEYLRDPALPPLRKTLIALEEHESFPSNFDTYLERDALPPTVTLDALIQALSSEQISGDLTAKGLKWGDVILAGVKQGLDRDAATTLDLWATHRDLMWSKAGRAYRHILIWLVENDADTLEAYAHDFTLHRIAKQNTWADLSRVAETRCLAGDRAQADRALTVLLKQRNGYFWQDRVIDLYTRAELFAPVLACRGEDKALAFLEDIKRLPPPAKRFIKRTYTDARAQAFVLNAARDTVELRTTRVMACWYYNTAGDKAAARAMFERGLATQGVWEQSVDGLKAQPREALTFERFERDAAYVAQQSPDVDGALIRCAATYAADPNQGYNTQKTLEEMAASWPSDAATAAIAKVMDVADNLARHDADNSEVPGLMMQHFAALPQAARCTLPDATLHAVLDRLPDYRWADDRVEVLTRMLRYLERAGWTTAPDMPCALRGRMS